MREPSLAACLVAGVTAVVLLVIYIVVRYVILAVEEVLHHAVQMRQVPEPALAACLVAAVVVLPLFLVYVTVRFLVTQVARERNASREPRVSPPHQGERS